MPGTVNYSNKLPVTIVIHPVKITTHNIFGHKQDKCFLESIFLRKHSSLYTLCISYACSYIPVFLLDLHTFLNHLCCSLFNLFLENNLLFYKGLFPDFNIYYNNNNKQNK